MHLDVGDLEPGVSGASSSGEPARFRYQDPGEVGAQSLPAAGGARREDGHITAAAPDVENVLPVLDLRGGQQPRRQPAQHPLMPLTLLDELPPTGSVPVFGLLHIHRHEGHAMTGPVPDAPFGTFSPEIATVAGHARAGSSARAAARLIDAMTDHPESAIRREARDVSSLNAHSVWMLLSFALGR